MNVVNGLVAVRGWDLTGRGMLQGTGNSVNWEINPNFADKKPSISNDNGLYCYNLENASKKFEDWRHVAGVVEIGGECIEHTDGIIRAEWCKILKLFVIDTTTQEQIRVLSMLYNVPIVLTNSIKDSLKNWYKKEGQNLIEHNKQVLEIFTHESVEQITPEIEHEKYEFKKVKDNDATFTFTYTTPWLSSYSRFKNLVWDNDEETPDNAKRRP